MVIEARSALKSLSNWEVVAEELGIPADRAALVKRNVELKAKLKQRGEAMTTVVSTWHDAFKHTGAVADCQQGLCSGMRELIALTEP